MVMYIAVEGWKTGIVPIIIVRGLHCSTYKARVQVLCILIQREVCVTAQGWSTGAVHFSTVRGQYCSTGLEYMSVHISTASGIQNSTGRVGEKVL
jgi:hypothetical protein